MGGTGSADQVRKQILLSLFFLERPYFILSGFYFFLFFSSSVVFEANFLEAVVC